VGQVGGAPAHRGLPRAVLPLVIAVAAAAALAGCGSRGTGGGGPSAILAHWASFPADADPRPPVLTGPTVLSPESGFSNDGDRDAFSRCRCPFPDAAAAAGRLG
jgi:hypothetical protein